LVSATGNASYANLPVNANLIGQLRSRNRPLDVLDWWSVSLLSVSMHLSICPSFCVVCRVAAQEFVNLMGVTNLATIFAAVLLSSDNVSQSLVFHYLLVNLLNLFCLVISVNTGYTNYADTVSQELYLNALIVHFMP